MSETKHTPGPWAFDKALFRIYVADGDVRPTVAYIDDDVTWGDQAEADGRLIAAAPDLLEALENLLDLDERCGWFSKQADAARAAIKRATEAV